MTAKQRKLLRLARSHGLRANAWGDGVFVGDRAGEYAPVYCETGADVLNASFDYRAELGPVELGDSLDALLPADSDLDPWACEPEDVTLAPN